VLPQFEAFHANRLGLPVATKWCSDQDVKAKPGAIFTKRTCDQCSLLWKGGDIVATSRLA